jgi:hypothetical protein
MPAFRLATDDDLRPITSQNMEDLWLLPQLYIPVEAENIPLPPLPFPTEGLELMRSCGIPKNETVADYVRPYPTALIAPKNFGQFVDRGELVYNGAEPASALPAARIEMSGHAVVAQVWEAEPDRR